MDDNDVLRRLQYPAVRAFDIASIRASIRQQVCSRDRSARIRYYRLMRWMRDEVKRLRRIADANFASSLEWRAKFLQAKEAATR